MKYIFLVTFFCSINAFGQYSTAIAELNNVSATVSDGGILFYNESTSTPGYEVPKGSGIHAIFSAAFWFAALDQNSQLHMSATRYNGGTDIFPGPISDSGMYTSPSYMGSYGTSIWSVFKLDIDDHILNWNQPGYIIPNSIANWPGNGDVLLGVAQQLAPYVDMNNNGLYEPSLGDYPNVRGDQATYIITNDGAKVHTSSGGEPLGVEVHLMIYQFATANYLNDVTFINARVFNRGNTDYPNFKASFFADGDLGGSTDDYFGSDSLRNMIYTYNGDLNDAQYGANPPAIGVVSLSNPMSGAGYFLNAGTPQYSDPVITTGYWNYMNNKWRFGEYWIYGGTGVIGSTGSTTSPTNFVFSGNPGISDWSETTNNNPPGDRRMIMNITGAPLMQGDNLCYDLAVVYASGGLAIGSSTLNLKNKTDLVQDFFTNQDFSCQTVTVGMDELSFLEATIYPNPSQGEFNIAFKESINNIVISITDVTGKIILSENYKNKSEVQIKLKEVEGVYFIRIQTDKGSSTKRIVLR